MISEFLVHSLLFYSTALSTYHQDPASMIIFKEEGEISQKAQISGITNHEERSKGRQ
jgi:hypothetical protein